MTYPFIILSLFICFVLSLEYLPQFAADEFMFVLQGAGKGHSLLAALVRLLSSAPELLSQKLWEWGLADYIFSELLRQFLAH